MSTEIDKEQMETARQLADVLIEQEYLIPENKEDLGKIFEALKLKMKKEGSKETLTELITTLRSKGKVDVLNIMHMTDISNQLSLEQMREACLELINGMQTQEMMFMVKNHFSKK